MATQTQQLRTTEITDDGPMGDMQRMLAANRQRLNQKKAAREAAAQAPAEVVQLAPADDTDAAEHDTHAQVIELPVTAADTGQAPTYLEKLRTVHAMTSAGTVAQPDPRGPSQLADPAGGGYDLEAWHETADFDAVVVSFPKPGDHPAQGDTEANAPNDPPVAEPADTAETGTARRALAPVVAFPTGAAHADTEPTTQPTAAAEVTPDTPAAYAAATPTDDPDTDQVRIVGDNPAAAPTTVAEAAAGSAAAPAPAQPPAGPEQSIWMIGGVVSQLASVAAVTGKPLTVDDAKDLIAGYRTGRAWRRRLARAGHFTGALFDGDALWLLDPAPA